MNVAALSLISAIALCVACNVGAKLEKEQSSGKTSHGTTGSLPRTQSDAETKRLYEKLEPEDREYDVFITHSQKTGQDQAGKLMLLLKNAGLRVWYDMQAQDLTVKGMEEGVSKSRNMLIVLTDGFMGREFCNAELRWARTYDCNLVGVKEDDTRHGKVNFTTELEDAPEDLKDILDKVEFHEFRRRDYEEAAMLQKLRDAIGMRPQRAHPLCAAPTTVYQTQREFAKGTAAGAPGMDSLKGVIYMTGFGSQMQYGDVEDALAEAEKVLLDKVDGGDAVWGPNNWAICFGGDQYDARRPDIGYLVHELKKRHSFLVLAVTNVHVQNKWGGVDDWVDAAYYYDNPRLPNGKIAWGGKDEDGKPVGATQVVFDLLATVLEVRLLCVGGGRIAAQEAELALDKGAKTAFALVMAKYPEAGQGLDGADNKNTRGPVADVYHHKCQDLNRRRVWVDSKLTMG